MSTIGNLYNKAVSTFGLGSDLSTVSTPVATPEKEEIHTSSNKFIAGEGGDSILKALQFPFRALASILLLPIQIKYEDTIVPSEKVPCTASNPDREDGKWPTTIVTGYDMEPTKPNECQSLADAVNIAIDDGAEVILGEEAVADADKILTKPESVDLTNKTNMTITDVSIHECYETVDDETTCDTF